LLDGTPGPAVSVTPVLVDPVDGALVVVDVPVVVEGAVVVVAVVVVVTGTPSVAFANTEEVGWRVFGSAHSAATTW